MKKISEHLGQIVVALAGVALLVAAVVVFKAPVGEFYHSMLDKETAITDTVLEGLDGINLGDLTGGGSGGSGGGENTTPAYDHNDPALHPNDGSTPTVGDEYEYGDYVYTYESYGNSFGASTFEEAKQAARELLMQQSGMSWDETVAFLIEQGAIQTEDDIWPQLGLTEDSFTPFVIGWCVKARDNTKTEYGPILESINGEPVVSVAATFYGCKSLKISPVIPNSVRDMQQAFHNCTNLTTAPVIPAGVTNIQGTFMDCTNLTVAPAIPEGVTNMHSTFMDCTNLLREPPMVTSPVMSFRAALPIWKTPSVAAPL